MATAVRSLPASGHRLQAFGPTRSSARRALLALVLVLAIANSPDTPGAELSCSAVQAGNPLDCAAAAPAALPDTGAGSAAGNPIDLVSGNKYQLETDLAPLPGALGLEIRRHYNSSDASAGAFGPGWRLGYEARLEDLRKRVVIVQADGRRIALDCGASARTGSGAQRTCRGSSPAQGSVVIDTGGQLARWRWPDGRQLEFARVADEVLALRRITLGDGATLTISLDSHARPVRVRDPQGRTLHISYGAGDGSLRRIARIVAPVGAWHYRHDSSGRLIAAAAPEESVARDDAGRALPVGVRRRIVRHYHYAPDDPRPSTLLTGISVEARLSISDGQSLASQSSAETAPVRIATYSYDEHGRALSSAGFGGANRVRIAYLDGARTLLTNADGVETTYRHALVAGKRRIVAALGPGCPVCSPGNRRYRYGPDGALRSVAVLAPDGSGRTLVTTSARLDELGRVVRVVSQNHGPRAAGPPRTLLRIAYHGRSRLPALLLRPSVVAGHEHRTALSFNEHAQLQQVRESGFAPGQVASAVSRTLRLSYDRSQRLIAVDGPLPGQQDTVRYAYDRFGRLTRIISAAGVVRELAYDHAGRVTRVVPDDGVAIEMSWSATGKLRALRRAGELRTLTYDAFGNVRELQRNGVPERLLAHDPAGRLRLAANSTLALAQYDYDASGRVIETVRSAFDGAATESLSRDALGRITRQQAAEGGVTVLGYDPRGLLSMVRDPAGILATLDYDELRQPRARTAAANTRSAATQLIEHDGQGEIAALTTPAGRRYALLRDDFGRIVASTDPAAGTSRYRYDQADRLIERVDPDGSVRSYRYDADGRLTERLSTSPGKSPRRVVLRYRGARLIAISNDAQSEERGFDEQSRLISITRGFHGEPPFTVTESFAYRPDGRLATRTLADGSVLRARSNATGRVVALEWIARPGAAAITIVSDIESDSLGARAWTYGNEVRMRATRSAAGRLMGMRYQGADGAELLSLALRYDALGNITAEKHGGEISQHRYDALGRLIATRSGDGLHHFAYDADGNRIASQSPGAPAAVTSPAEPLRFDAAGRVIADALHRYLWSADGRLAEIRPASAPADAAPLARYDYNARGERVSAWSGAAAVPTHFLYQDGLVAAELDRHGRILRHYFHLEGMPIATIDLRWPQPGAAGGAGPLQTTVTFLHGNHLRAPVMATDRFGYQVWRAWSQPFGEPRRQPATTGRPKRSPEREGAQRYRQPLAFAGQYRDDDSGLHYNLQRYYNPRSGRYLSPDPLGPLASSNAYAYAESNPRSGIDPLGLILFAFDGTGMTADSRTNVSWLANDYGDNASGIIGASRPFYEPGPGSSWWSAGDSVIAYTLSLVVARQLQRLDNYLRATLDNAASLTGASSAPLSTTVDVIGFSRGAAAARSFANQVAKREREGYYLRLLRGRCVDLELRFMGLFDTVLSIAAGSFDLGIPEAVAYAAQAVAVNEHRTLFPLESIEPDFSAIGASPARVELGFVGSHSDVGGGYSCASGCDGGDLSDIALNWMLEQARRAGVTMAVLPPEQRAVSNPVLHNEVYALPFGAWGSDQDRAVHYPNATNAPWPAPLQRSAPIAGLDTATSSAFIITDPDPGQQIEGSVDLDAYRSWLADTYGLVLGP